ncbi:conserved hypothetical protein [Flavobacterium sp. 9AF]|uniref:T6SS phospholipase effector Tle1-like catalytic domain-containing protein n=1 Tax=Flavobacterium sp. 9AF TaxID=2653142 RepID=UPI0012F195A0|nr:DUF2235 domain-containing protein [Flavobacterium sp. 9AF]VXC01393.1 conserved hypothetical protein [Flavobacterium sp. 9AF]
MATNISFGDYSPPEPPKGAIDVLIGVFFDGTLNNKNNTQEKLNNSEHFKKKGVEKKEDSSYYNDWSNVARLWKYYDSPLKTYVEGIGTEDREKDATMGFAFGTGSTGIRGKVRKGCENIVDLIIKEKNKVSATRVSTLTLDVYGFSRGAAAARNFVHEVNKAKYKAILEATGSGEYTSFQNTDSDGFVTQRDEFPRRGHLGLKLEENGIEVDNVRVRFLGIFDTVSSYSKNFSAFPNFNDVEELSLNDIGSASNVVHYVAENEHRENFSLTNTHVGIQKTFPGVHSDIGGSYNDGVETIEEIETSWTSRNNLNPLIERLINEGWYKREQLEITGGNLYWALKGTRNLKKSYSYIPLHFMGESSKNKQVNINTDKLESFYDMSTDTLLERVKAKLRTYVFGSGKQYLLSNDLSSEERNDLFELRNKYLHWSARREGIGMDPNSDRKRIYY